MAKPPEKPDIPVDCVTWFDGCNSCGVENGNIQYCSERFCAADQMEAPYCSQFLGNDIPGLSRIYEVEPKEKRLPPVPDDYIVNDGDRPVSSGDPVLPTPPEPPAGCERWFDGGNACEVVDGEIEACTEKMCDLENEEEPRCLSFVDEEGQMSLDPADELVNDSQAPVLLVEPQVELSPWGMILYHLFGFGK